MILRLRVLCTGCIWPHERRRLVARLEFDDGDDDGAVRALRWSDVVRVGPSSRQGRVVNVHAACVFFHIKPFFYPWTSSTPRVRAGSSS